VFAPDYEPEEIQEIAKKLRQQAGLGDEPLGDINLPQDSIVGKVADKITPN
jgi:hypothetical protein